MCWSCRRRQPSSKVWMSCSGSWHDQDISFLVLNGQCVHSQAMASTNELEKEQKQFYSNGRKCSLRARINVQYRFYCSLLKYSVNEYHIFLFFFYRFFYHFSIPNLYSLKGVTAGDSRCDSNGVIEQLSPCQSATPFVLSWRCYREGHFATFSLLQRARVSKKLVALARQLAGVENIVINDQQYGNKATRCRWAREWEDQEKSWRWV